jgi:hypothetical protein
MLDSADGGDNRAAPKADRATPSYAEFKQGFEDKASPAPRLFATEAMDTIRRDLGTNARRLIQNA